MSTCYLHIGPHKTGTSTIQRCLLKNTALLSENGLFIPVMKAAKSGGIHHRLAAELAHGHPANFQKQFMREIEEASNPKRILLSSENFSVRINGKDCRDRIADFFAHINYEIHAIAFVRPQVEIANSFYTEHIKKLVHRPTVDSFVQGIFSDENFDFCKKFDGLIGDTRFHKTFVPFDSKLLSAGLCEYFLRLFGVHEDVIAKCIMPRPRNETPGSKTIAAYQEIGKAIESKTVDDDQADLAHIAYRLGKMAESLGWNRDKFDGFSPEQKQAISERFRESNERFSQRVWHASWQSIFGKDEESAIARPRTIFVRENAAPEERQEFDEFCEFALEMITKDWQTPQLPR